ncbi:hypothetical protein HHK36_020009 [Tetracentron sinense]|uniref:Uncharacterized protein n=1 Tax=Tetracentron sinense TaxID=13715 RepID=A0A835D8G0_TETSI|nr:hypothetical protein HHK36_020009 [Tetracentron sinense]
MVRSYPVALSPPVPAKFDGLDSDPLLLEFPFRRYGFGFSFQRKLGDVAEYSEPVVEGERSPQDQPDAPSDFSSVHHLPFDLAIEPSTYLFEHMLLWSEGRSDWMPLSELFNGTSLRGSDNSTAEVEEAEADVLKHGSTSDGEEQFIDDDRCTHNWYLGLRAWVPQVAFAYHFDNTFCSGEQYGVQEMTFLEEEEVFRTVKVADTSVKEEANGASEGSGSKTWSKEANSWFDLKVNTHVYVTELPDDVTAEEEANSWFDLEVNTHVYVTELPDDDTAEEGRESSKFMMLGLMIVCGWGLKGETIFDFILWSGLT